MEMLVCESGEAHAARVLLDFIFLLIGTVFLLAGAYVLVQGSVGLALRLGISRVVVGATVVAFGTSAPELLVTLTAEIRGSTGVAVGNVLGSNVANVFLVLGLASVINPMIVHARLIRWEIPVLLLATAATLLFAVNGVLGRVEGIVMLLMLSAFIVISPRLFPETAAAAEAEVGDEPAANNLLMQIGMVLLGLVGLAGGADLIVRGASSIATSIGMSEFVVGVLIVAVGTSLPEIATSVLAAIRKEHEIAVANVVGSNIFNLLAVFGASSAITTLPMQGVLYQFELPMLAFSSLILVPLVWPRYRVSRAMGVLLLLGYVAFALATVLRGNVTG